MSFNTAESRANVEAEMCCLGAMILSEQAILRVCSSITENDFFLPAHRSIFAAVADLQSRRVSVDLVVLKDELIRRKLLKQVGGTPYLIQIAEVVPSASNVEHYAAIVRECALVRRIAAAGAEISALALDVSLRGHDLAVQASERIQLATSSSGRSAALDIRSIDVSGEEMGVSSGLKMLDAYTSCNGLPIGQTVLVRAKTKAGKTPLMTQFLLDAWRRGERVCYALFADLTPKQWKRRLIKLVCGQSGPGPNLETNLKWESALAEIDDAFAENRITVYNGRADVAAGTAEMFSAWLLAEEAISPWGMVCADYLQKMRAAGNHRNTFEVVQAVGSTLDRTAGQLSRSPLVVGSQVTAGHGGARFAPESESDCGLCIEIVREDNLRDTQLVIPYNRFGPAGTIEGIEFNDRTLRFEEPVWP